MAGPAEEGGETIRASVSLVVTFCGEPAAITPEAVLLMYGVSTFSIKS